MRIAKYEFDSREQAQSKIDALGTATDEDGNEYPTHKSTIVQLGNIVLEQGEYDEEGEEILLQYYQKVGILTYVGTMQILLQ